MEVGFVEIAPTDVIPDFLSSDQEGTTRIKIGYGDFPDRLQLTYS